MMVMWQRFAFFCHTVMLRSMGKHMKGCRA